MKTLCLAALHVTVGEESAFESRAPCFGKFSTRFACLQQTETKAPDRLQFLSMFGIHKYQASTDRYTPDKDTTVWVTRECFAWTDKNVAASFWSSLQNWKFCAWNCEMHASLDQLSNFEKLVVTLMCSITAPWTRTVQCTRDLRLSLPSSTRRTTSCAMSFPCPGSAAAPRRLTAPPLTLVHFQTTAEGRHVHELSLEQIKTQCCVGSSPQTRGAVTKLRPPSTGNSRKFCREAPLTSQAFIWQQTRMDPGVGAAPPPHPLLRTTKTPQNELAREF